MPEKLKFENNILFFPILNNMYIYSKNPQQSIRFLMNFASVRDINYEMNSGVKIPRSEKFLIQNFQIWKNQIPEIQILELKKIIYKYI